LEGSKISYPPSGWRQQTYQLSVLL
jgi:hypothetical protein